MASREGLHNELIGILGTTGEKESRVYFQPPASVKMKYPCIRYSKKGNSAVHADNKVYRAVNRYDGVVIDYDPDSTFADDILHHFEMCSLGQGYIADNLNHFPFTIYY